MGGSGSGWHWYWGAKDTTDDYRSIDVRRWNRDGLLTLHQSFGWQWSRHGEVFASINARAEPNRVILTYRHRSGNDDWKDERYPVYLDWTACNLGGQRPWFSVSCPRLRSACRYPLRWQLIRMPSLLPTSLHQPAGIMV